MLEHYFKTNEEALYCVEDLFQVGLNGDDFSTFIHNYIRVFQEATNALSNMSKSTNPEGEHPRRNPLKADEVVALIAQRVAVRQRIPQRSRASSIRRVLAKMARSARSCTRMPAPQSRCKAPRTISSVLRHRPSAECGQKGGMLYFLRCHPHG